MTGTDDAVVTCDDLEVAYGTTLALSRTSFHAVAGESVAIMGPSGSGKTTLLQCIEGLIRPTAGTLTVLGQDQVRATRASRADLRRTSMGLIFQSPELLPEFSVSENVAFTLLFDGVRRPAALRSAVEALAAVGLEHRAGARIPSLSGGESQRVAVARALVRPEMRLLIADEPTASLDVENARLVTETLLDEASARDATVLLATHDPAIAAMCDRIFQIERHEARV